MSRHQLVSAWRAAPLAELAWVDAQGRPDATTVVPLVHGNHPLVALTYDRLSLARRLGAADRVLFAVTSPALGGGRTPVSAWAKVSVHEDREGHEFVARYLTQELAKHPPARRLADSPLLRREHPWYVPRLLVRVTWLEGDRGHTLRDALAVTATSDGPRADTVDLDGVDRDAKPTSALPDGPTVILQHGADLPDLDQPWWRRWRGEVRDGVMHVDRFDERALLTQPLGVWRRWRNQVALEKACRAGLREARGARDSE